MTDFTPQQLEWAARLLCVAHGIDPDAQDYKEKCAWQERDTLEEARRLLAELERQRVRAMTARHVSMCVPLALDPEHEAFLESAFQAAPICPDAE